MSNLTRNWILLIVVLAAALSPMATAKNHALLIGVGAYPTQPLEGPRYDVSALKSVLMGKWNFAESEVQVLLDEEASKNRILSSIDALYARTNQGDNVFIYFSGHGTSAQDYEIRAPLPTTSGAFIPHDIAGVTSRKELVEKLVVGRDDLKPRFQRFDSNGRHLFVAIDACYSGNTVRGAFRKEQLPTRHLSLNQLVPRSFGADLDTSGGSEWEDQSEEEAVYPYSNVFYLGASGEHEKAQDIPERMMDEFSTIDRQPHGAFTDSLLRFLDKPETADINKDGNVSYAELRQSLQSLMQRRGFNHTPQGLPSINQDDDRLAQRSVFLFDTPTKAADDPGLKDTVQTASASAPAPSAASEPPEEPAAPEVAPSEPEPAAQVVASSPQPAPSVSSEPVVDQPAPEKSGFRVYVDPALNVDGDALEGLADVQLVSEGYDIGFIAGDTQAGESASFHVVDKGGELIRSLSRIDASVIEKQVVYERWLIGMFAETRDSARGMNIEAGFSDLARGSAAVAGEQIGLEVRLPDGGYLMIINYTSDGTINVIYPFTNDETQSVASNSKISFTDLMEVTKPYGRDFVHLIALDSIGDTYKTLTANPQFSYNSAMGDRLKTLLTSRDVAKGVAELTLLTAEQSAE